jgi:hypothetical protein
MCFVRSSNGALQARDSPGSHSHVILCSPSNMSAVSATLHDVCVCHVANEDAEFVGALVSALEARGLRVHYAQESIERGVELEVQIERGFAHAKYALVVLGSGFFEATYRCPWVALRVQLCLESVRHRYRAIGVVHEASVCDPRLSMVPRALLWSSQIGPDALAYDASQLLRREGETRARLRSTLVKWAPRAATTTKAAAVVARPAASTAAPTPQSQPPNETEGRDTSRIYGLWGNVPATASSATGNTRTQVPAARTLPATRARTIKGSVPAHAAGVEPPNMWRRLFTRGSRGPSSPAAPPLAFEVVPPPQQPRVTRGKQPPPPPPPRSSRPQPGFISPPQAPAIDAQAEETPPPTTAVRRRPGAAPPSDTEAAISPERQAQQDLPRKGK